MPPPNPELLPEGCRTVWTNWLELQATYYKDSLPTEATQKPTSNLSPQGWTYFWLPGAFPMLPLATRPFFLCSGLENQVKPRSLMGHLRVC